MTCTSTNPLSSTHNALPLPQVQGMTRKSKRILRQTDATPTASVEPKTDPPADTPDVSAAPSGTISPTVSRPGKPKPFAKKPKPAVETPDSPIRPSKKSAGASNGSGETSNDSVGTPNPSKNRFNGPKKHRSAGSPSGTAANSPDAS